MLKYMLLLVLRLARRNTMRKDMGSNPTPRFGILVYESNEERIHKTGNSQKLTSYSIRL